MNTNTAPTMTVEVFCAWHPEYFGSSKMLGEVQVSIAQGSHGSHGVCPACRQQMRRSAGLVK